MPQNKYDMLMSNSRFEKLIAGEPFGSGSSRTVFEVAGDHSVVVKKLKREFPGPNMVEWLVWNAIKETSLSQCFGACLAISETGRYLMMERLDNLSTADWWRVPKVPSWLDDRKVSAFGQSATGVVKVRDYAMVKIDEALATAAVQQPAWAMTAQRPNDARAG